MKILRLSTEQTTIPLMVQGAYTFLNASELVYELETVLEHIEAAGQFENIRVSFSLTFLDTRCKKLVVEYIRQFNTALKERLPDETHFEWKYDGSDDDLMEFGQLLNEISSSKFTFVDCDTPSTSYDLRITTSGS